MITDIPEPADFVDTGMSLLCFAWDSATDLLSEVRNAEDSGEDDPELTEAFWTASRQTLMVATSIAQQGLEFIIKGRIAEVSPFLLVAGNPRDWPRGNGDVPFADFRTIDAQDLTRVHDTVASRRFEPEFVEKFEELRTKRNAIVHTIDRRIAVQVADVLRDILAVYKHLFPDGDWFTARREYLERTPTAELYSADFVDQRVVWEASLLAEVLTKGEMARFFNFNVRQRRYICPVCAYNSDYLEMLPETAHLAPNAPSSTTVHCFVCGTDTLVTRRDCEFDDCPGNVIEADEGQCLTCGRHAGPDSNGVWITAQA